MIYTPPPHGFRVLIQIHTRIRGFEGGRSGELGPERVPVADDLWAGLLRGGDDALRCLALRSRAFRNGECTDNTCSSILMYDVVNILVYVTRSTLHGIITDWSFLPP